MTLEQAIDLALVVGLFASFASGKALGMWLCKQPRDSRGRFTKRDQKHGSQRPTHCETS